MANSHEVVDGRDSFIDYPSGVTEVAPPHDPELMQGFSVALRLANEEKDAYALYLTIKRFLDAYRAPKETPFDSVLGTNEDDFIIPAGSMTNKGRDE
jgi:hypothetical protein